LLTLIFILDSVFVLVLHGYSVYGREVEGA
jgi:hypothetical protein